MSEREIKSKKGTSNNYKSSQWAPIIDATSRLVNTQKQGRSEKNSTKEMKKWLKWMKKDGFRLSDHEVSEKMNEIMGEDLP